MEKLSSFLYVCLSVTTHPLNIFTAEGIENTEKIDRLMKSTVFSISCGYILILFSEWAE